MIIKKGNIAYNFLIVQTQKMNTRKEYLQQTLTKEALYATCHDYH